MFLVGHFITKTQSIIKYAHAQVHGFFRVINSREGHQQFIVMIAHEALLAPGLLPSAIACRRGVLRNC